MAEVSGGRVRRTPRLSWMDSVKITPRNFTVDIFVMINSRILMSNAFFWLEITICEVLLTFNVECFFLVGDYHMRSFTNVQRKSVGREPVINCYQFPVHCGMNIFNVTVGCKNCCIISKMNEMHLV